VIFPSRSLYRHGMGTWSARINSREGARSFVRDHLAAIFVEHRASYAKLARKEGGGRLLLSDEAVG